KDHSVQRYALRLHSSCNVELVMAACHDVRAIKAPCHELAEIRTQIEGSFGLDGLRSRHADLLNINHEFAPPVDDISCLKAGSAGNRTPERSVLTASPPSRP